MRAQNRASAASVGDTAAGAMWQAAKGMGTARPISEVKGLWFTVGRRYVLEHFGEETVQEMAARLGDRHGPVFTDALPSEWYPEEALQQMLAALDVVVACGDQARYVDLLEEASLLAVHHFFRALLRLVPPQTMLRKIPTMWTLIRRGVGRVSVEADETHAVVTYTEFPYFDDVHYRLLTLAAIRCLMTLCGTKHARVAVAGHTHDSLVIHVDY